MASTRVPLFLRVCCLPFAPCSLWVGRSMTSGYPPYVRILLQYLFPSAVAAAAINHANLALTAHITRLAARRNLS